MAIDVIITHSHCDLISNGCLGKKHERAFCPMCGRKRLFAWTREKGLIWVCYIIDRQTSTSIHANYANSESFDATARLMWSEFVNTSALPSAGCERVKTICTMLFWSPCAGLRWLHQISCLQKGLHSLKMADTAERKLACERSCRAANQFPLI